MNNSNDELKNTHSHNISDENPTYMNHDSNLSNTIADKKAHYDADNGIKTKNSDSSQIKPSGEQNNSNKAPSDNTNSQGDASNSTKNNNSSDLGGSFSVAQSAKETAQTVGNEMQNLSSNQGDLYADDEDGLTGTVNDVKNAAAGTAKAGAEAAMAAGKATAGDAAGAVKSALDSVKDATKAAFSFVKLLIPLVIIFVLVISIFLQSPAMIWQSLSKEYEKWTYNKAIMAINAGIDDAAFNVVDEVSNSIGDFLGDNDFKTKCNQYYADYYGNGYTHDYSDGTSLSIELQPSLDGQHEDAYITYIAADGTTNTVVYKNADVTYNDLDTDVSYAQIINAFNLYREKKTKSDGFYNVYSTYTQETDDTITELRGNVYNNSLSQDDFLNNTETLLSEKENDTEAQPLENITNDDRTDSKAVWGLADTGALYYYMTHDKTLSRALYDYKITNAEGEEVSNVITEKENTLVNNNSYQIVIDVTCYDANDRQTSNGTSYSYDVMKGFGITSEEEIEKVVSNTNISNALLNCATQSDSTSAKDFKEYISFSQPKILFEKIIGGPSVVEKMIDAGLYTDWSEDTIRRLMASYASAWVNRSQAVSNTDETFFFRTKDEFTDAFSGTSAGWEYDASTGTYQPSNAVTFNELDAAKYLGEDGMFMTYLFSKTLNAGMLKDENGNALKPRTYIFPENYPAGAEKDQIKQLFSSQDYYYYFQQYGINGNNAETTSEDTAWYQLTDYLHGANATAWDKAFDEASVEESTQHTSSIQKGDLIFLTYFNAGFDENSLKALANGDFTPFYGNKGYQVGMVTDVDYTAKTLKFVIYNYDDDPIKENYAEKTFDSTVQKYLGSSGLKVTEVTISYDGNGSGRISPEWNDTVNNNIKRINAALNKIGANKTWEPNPLTFIVGYGKPNYSAYADEINRRMEKYREEMAKSIAEAALDLGGGTLGYPLDENHRNVSQDYGHNGHQGIDYGVAVGTPVYAADDGVVLKSEAITEGGTVGRGTPAKAPNGKFYRSYGEVIEIQHSDTGLTTYYAHLSKRLINQGDRVQRGQLIGYSGNTGNSSGPHLHFEVRKSGKVVNPHMYLTDSTVKKLGNYSYQMNSYISSSPVNGQNINVTFYCPGSCCNGSNAGTTAMGFKISNTHKYYDQNQAYVACNWLPLGTKIRIDFGDDESMGWFKNENLVYTVVDTGSASRLNTSTIDVLVPNDHSKTNIGKSGGQNYVKIKILSLGKQAVNV